jgi:hypothetical protein
MIPAKQRRDLGEALLLASDAGRTLAGWHQEAYSFQQSAVSYRLETES